MMKVLIRGAGDLASGIACRLHRCGFQVAMTEIGVPTTVRRTVAFSPAVYLGEAQVEDIRGVRCDSLEEIEAAVQQGQVAVVQDPQCQIVFQWKPDVVVDAILAKTNLGTRITDAGTVIGVGPGFTAGADCHCVVETKRGHDLGRCIWSGSAIPNTGVPGMIGGYAKERLIKAGADGIFLGRCKIGDLVEKDQVVGVVVTESGQEMPVRTLIPGVVRGLLQDGVPVKMGMKSGDVDPRGVVDSCYTVSDKAAAIGGGVLEGILSHQVMLESRRTVLVLLAAGSSRRFQGNKLLHEFQGKPMYRHLADQVKCLMPGIFDEKVVVTQYDEIADDLESEGFLVVRNQEPELGISHSIHLAIEAICPKRSDGGSDGPDCVKDSYRRRETAVCFAVCDQPFLRKETIQSLIEGWKKSKKGLGCLGYQGELGNPAVFSERYLDQLLVLQGDVGGKKVIRRHLDDLFLLEVEEERELLDIDVNTEHIG